MLLYAVTGEIEQLGMLVLLMIGIGIVGIIVYLPLGGWVGQLAAMVVQSGLLVFALMWFYGLALQQAALITGLFFGIKLATAIVLGLLLASAEPEAFRPVDVPPGAIAIDTILELPRALDFVPSDRWGQHGSWTCCSTPRWCFC